MVFLALYMKCELEEVSEIRLPDDYKFVVDIMSGEEKIGESVVIDRNHEAEMTGSRGTANFVIKIPGSKHQASINVLDNNEKQVYKKIKKMMLHQIMMKTQYKC